MTPTPNPEETEMPTANDRARAECPEHHETQAAAHLAVCERDFNTMHPAVLNGRLALAQAHATLALSLRARPPARAPEPRYPTAAELVDGTEEGR